MTTKTRATAPTAAAWRNRIVGHADVAPAELVPNPANWRTHPPEQQRALAGALAEIGWVGEVLVNRTTGHVVDLSVYRAGLIEAVRVPKGSWTIHFHYHAPYIEVGVGASAVSFVLLIGVVIGLGLAKRRRRTSKVLS